MSEPAFPPNIAAALDRLTVPPLPDGFAERLAARIEAGVLPAEADAALPPLPSPRLSRMRQVGWRRGGRIVASVAALGLATATAAASGFFGQPVYVPVVSETLAKAELVPLPQKAEKPKVGPPKVEAKVEAKVETKAAAAEPAEPEAVVPLTGKAAVRDVYTKLRADPEFKALPKAERMARTKAQYQQMLRDGVMTQAELKEAMGEIRAEQKAKARVRIDAEVQRRIDNGTLKPEAAEAIARRRAVIDATAEERQRLSVEQRAQRREAMRQLTPDQKARLRALHEQLRTAAPAEKPAIRREISVLWDEFGFTPAKNTPPPDEGNPGTIR
jgi:hypothetical protein